MYVKGLWPIINEPTGSISMDVPRLATKIRNLGSRALIFKMHTYYSCPQYEMRFAIPVAFNALKQSL